MPTRIAGGLGRCFATCVLAACAESTSEESAPYDAGYAPTSSAAATSTGSAGTPAPSTRPAPASTGGSNTASTSSSTTNGAGESMNTTGTGSAPADPLSDLGALGAGLPTSFALPTAKLTDAGVPPDECMNQLCFDVFDCYIFHPDKTDCGFTACDFGICK